MVRAGRRARAATHRVEPISRLPCVHGLVIAHHRTIYDRQTGTMLVGHSPRSGRGINAGARRLRGRRRGERPPRDRARTETRAEEPAGETETEAETEAETDETGGARDRDRLHPTPSTSGRRRGGDEEPARTLALFTGRGGRISPRVIRVPAFISVRVEPALRRRPRLRARVRRRAAGGARGPVSVSRAFDGLRPERRSSAADRRRQPVRVEATAEPGLSPPVGAASHRIERPLPERSWVGWPVLR